MQYFLSDRSTFREKSWQLLQISLYNFCGPHPAARSVESAALEFRVESVRGKKKEDFSLSEKLHILKENFPIKFCRNSDKSEF